MYMFNEKKTLFTSKVGLNLRKKPSKVLHLGHSSMALKLDY